MPLDTLVLDLGNVIAFFDHRIACRALSALSGGRTTEEQVFQTIFGTPLEEDFDCGRISTAAFVAELRDRLRLTGSDDEIGRAWADIFRLNNDVVSFLPDVKAAGTRLVLASSTNALHFEWLQQKHPTLFSDFDELVVSYRVGARKPAAAFFDSVVTAAQAPMTACVYVDDKSEYVAAATARGMSGIVYRPESRIVAELVSLGFPPGDPASEMPPPQ